MCEQASFGLSVVFIVAEMHVKPDRPTLNQLSKSGCPLAPSSFFTQMVDEGFNAWADNNGFQDWQSLEPAAKKLRVEAAGSQGQQKQSARLDANSAALKAMSGAAAVAGRQKVANSYENHGADPDDIKRRLAATVCKCKKRCAGRVQTRALLTVCSLFWSLTAEDRGMLLRHTYQSAVGDDEDQGASSSDPSMSRVQWYIAGVQVCFPTFCALLSTGTNTVRRQIQGVPSLQRSNIGGDHMPASRKHGQSDAVDWFFQELYHSAAEPLPEDAKCAFNDAGVFLAEQALPNQFEDSFSTAAGAPAIQPSSNPAEPLSDSTPTLAWMSAAAMLTVASAASVIGLAVRYLPHATLADLYAQFTSAWEAHVASSSGGFPGMPSFTTFCRRWQKCWRKVMRFRKSSQHAQCQTCFELQKHLRTASASWGAKLQAARDLRQHYNDQYMDRCLYWSMRYMSKYGSDILCIIIDSMDKAKCAIEP